MALIRPRRDAADPPSAPPPPSQGFSVIIWASLSFLWLPGSYIFGYHTNSEVRLRRSPARLGWI